MALQSAVIPAPLGGLNLTGSPVYSPQLQGSGIGIDITEARKLDNYWIFDSGIRQIPEYVQMYALTGANSNFNALNSYDSILFYASQRKLFKRTSLSLGADTDVTGAATITLDDWNPCIFAKKIFLFNGADTPLYHDYGGGNFTAFSATGPTVANLKQGCAYKSRLYIVEKSSTKVWYGAVDAFSGTFLSFDIGSILTYGSSTLLACFTWSYNQGQQNEELFVFLTSRGEVLIYSGDYPSHPNWQLVVKTTIPLPGGYDVTASGQPFCNVGNDVYITTQRGVIPLSSIVAGLTAVHSDYAISRKIKNQIANDTKGGAVDRINPFVYFRDSLDLASMYVLNYERGAWSHMSLTFPTVNSQAQVVISVQFFLGATIISTGSVAGTGGGIGYINMAAGAPNTQTYRWATPYIDFLSGKICQSVKAQVVSSNYEENSTVKTTLGVGADFAEPGALAYDTKNTDVTANIPITQELSTPGVGTSLSYVFNRVGASSGTEKNEIHTMRAFYQAGGDT